MKNTAGTLRERAEIIQAEADLLFNRAVEIENDAGRDDEIKARKREIARLCRMAAPPRCWSDARIIAALVDAFGDTPGTWKLTLAIERRRHKRIDHARRDR